MDRTEEQGKKPGQETDEIGSPATGELAHCVDQGTFEAERIYESGKVLSGIALDGVAQKSMPLIEATSSLNLLEMKIFEAALSRINSHDPSVMQVSFWQSDFTKSIGVSTKINRDVLTNACARLMSEPIVIKGEKEDLAFTMFLGARTKTIGRKNRIDLVFNPLMMRYIYNIDELGYVKYTYRSIAQFKSVYTMRIFMYLKRMSFRYHHKPWTESYADFKACIGATDKTYESYGEFNRWLLKPSQKSILELAGLEFTYRGIRKDGAPVHAIEFTVLRDESYLALEKRACLQQEAGEEETGNTCLADRIQVACGIILTVEQTGQVTTLLQGCKRLIPGEGKETESRLGKLYQRFQKDSSIPTNSGKSEGFDVFLNEYLLPEIRSADLEDRLQAACKGDFTDLQILQLRTMLESAGDFGSDRDDAEKHWTGLLSQLYCIYQERRDAGKIKSKRGQFPYFKAMVENRLQEMAEAKKAGNAQEIWERKPSPNRFKNFEERKLDYDALEEELIRQQARDYQAMESVDLDALLADWKKGKKGNR